LLPRGLTVIATSRMWVV